MEINPFFYSIGTRVRDKHFLRMLEPKKGDIILDVGCGLGYQTDLLSRHGAICTGIEIDDLCLRYCRNTMRGTYKKVDLTKFPYPFKNNTFDKVLCSEVLEHIQANGEVLDEIHRIVRPGGILLVTTPCNEGILGGMIKRIGHSSVDGNSREYHHHKGYSYKSLSALLSGHGFKVVENSYTLVFLTELYMGLTKLAIHALMMKKIDSQANALRVNKSFIWRIHKLLFPAIMLMAKFDESLSKIIKGHMIIVKAVKV